MKIKRFLSISIIGLALITCSLGAVVALDTWMAMDELAVAKERLSALRAMSDIPATILPQRSLLALMVTTAAPGDASQPATLAKIRQTSDAAFAQAVARARALAGSGEEASTLDAGITSAASLWVMVEQSVESVVTKPIGERGDLAARVLQESISINSAITALMRDELRRLANASGNSFRFADIANTVWQLRETAGSPAGLIINLLASHKPASPELRASLMKFEAQVQTIWDNLAPLAAAQDTPTRLKQALADVKSAYFDTLVPAEQKIAAEFDSGNYPFEAMDFRNNRTQKVWPTMTALRDVAYQLADDAISTDRARASSRFYIAIVGSVIAVLISLVISLLVGRRVTRPLVAITRSMTRISEGELELSIPGAGRSDEIGDIATALQVFKDSLRQNRDLELASMQEREAASLRRNTAMADLAASFETSVGGIVRAVSSSSRDLEDAARAMTRTAVDTSNRSTNVAAAAEEASTNVGAVASSAEELGASVHEISRQVQQSSQMSEAAVREANETAAVVRELAMAATRISDVLSLISTIAGQTNLLALNATIEAARAGEAGRGFAIVASEVKELATQTAKATSEISAQISAIQTSTDRAVGAIGGIATTIQSMNAVATAISKAVAQQGMATRDIVRTISQASAGTSDVTSNIGAVAQAAQQSGLVAQQVLSSSGTLSGQAEDLRRQVDRFLETVRAA